MGETGCRIVCVPYPIARLAAAKGGWSRLTRERVGQRRLLRVGDRRGSGRPPLLAVRRLDFQLLKVLK